jgi:hypothetical protein
LVISIPKPEFGNEINRSLGTRYAGPALLGWLRDVTQQMESGLLLLALAQGLAILLITRLKV